MNYLDKINRGHYYAVMIEIIKYGYPKAHIDDPLWIYYADQIIPLNYMVILATMGAVTPLTKNNLPSEDILVLQFAQMGFRVVRHVVGRKDLQYLAVSFKSEDDQALADMKHAGIWHYDDQLNGGSERNAPGLLIKIQAGDRIAVRISHQNRIQDFYPIFGTVIATHQAREGGIHVAYDVNSFSISIKRKSIVPAADWERPVLQIEDKEHVRTLFNETPFRNPHDLYKQARPAFKPIASSETRKVASPATIS
ncbi:hypothetical protein [Chitinophaga arvensicola]|uniref:Uncharacterized protein n=1 Tax=Chitinophaga arvensicola TaxID=29529 RepID=A0A1I0PR22_9BACT|nr:hypothetical protein [Chitinophaga arvensicola]SEW16744.1 hypothetical protein SAMN04488122_0920 [Chitinophaga arvensicola]